MADADWALYKQIRGRELPQRMTFEGGEYLLAQTFKQDFYACTGRYAKAGTAGSGPDQVVLKIYHRDPLWKIIPLGWMGNWLWRREMHFGRATASVPNVARVLGSYGETGIVREFIPGRNLREHTQQGHSVDAAFFPTLRKTLDALHALGISHNDLSKPENVLVRENGGPVLIDFQIAVGPSRIPLWAWFKRRVIPTMQRSDHYHLTKLHRRTRVTDFTVEQLAAARRQGLLVWLHGYIRRPYRKLRHFVLDHFLLAKAPAETR